MDLENNHLLLTRSYILISWPEILFRQFSLCILSKSLSKCIYRMSVKVLHYQVILNLRELSATGQRLLFSTASVCLLYFLSADDFSPSCKTLEIFIWFATVNLVGFKNQILTDQNFFPLHQQTPKADRVVDMHTHFHTLLPIIQPFFIQLLCVSIHICQPFIFSLTALSIAKRSD